MSKYEVVNSYAKALYDVSKENGNSEEILRQLDSLQKAVRSVEEDIYFDEKDAEEFAQKFSFSGELKEALKVLAINGRFSILPDIYEEFQKHLDQDMSVVRGEILSADVLNNQQRKEIEDYVNKVTNKRAILSFQEDPSILGGFVVNVGSMKMDGSLKNQLENLKNLINNGVH